MAGQCLVEERRSGLDKTLSVSPGGSTVRGQSSGGETGQGLGSSSPGDSICRFRASAPDSVGQGCKQLRELNFFFPIYNNLASVLKFLIAQ